MSFYSIKDPVVRDAKIKELIAIKDRIKKRNLANRMGWINRNNELEEQYKPVLKSQEKITDAIVEHLEPLTKSINAHFNPVKEVRSILGVKRRRVEQPSKFTKLYERLMQRDPNLDTSFGIYIDPENNMKIGAKDIEITSDDDILVDGRLYTITEGLWTLITENNPDPQLYEKADLIQYAGLMNQTDALRTDFDHESVQPRASSSKKWKHILSHIWKGIKEGEVGAIHLIDASGKGIFADNHIENGKLYLRKNGCCYRIRKPKQGDGLYFSPQPPYLPFGFFRRRPVLRS